MNLKSSLLTATLLCTVVTGCDRRVDTRGNFLEDEKVQEVKGSSMTKLQVSNLLGYPTSKAAFSDDTWYYMGEVVKHRSFLTPRLVDRRVVIIKFKNDRVHDLEQRGIKASKHVIPVKRRTRTSGDKVNPLKEIFGNVGRIHKGNIEAAK